MLLFYWTKYTISLVCIFHRCVQEREGKKSDTRPLQRRSCAHKILHHQTKEKGRERGREENRRKGRSASSTCVLSNCATEKRIERCCVQSCSLLLICTHFSVVLQRERERGASVFFSSFFFVFAVYYSLSSTLIYLSIYFSIFFFSFYISSSEMHAHT